MFRFLTTLIVTGVGVLAAVAWWSDRDSAGPWPELPAAEAPGRAAPTAEAAEPTAPARESETRAPAARPSRLEPAQAKPVPVRAAAAAPAAALLGTEAPRPLPAIPAPRLAPRAAYTRTVAPAPAAPEPIPSPIGGRSAPADGVGETRIPEPAAFAEGAVDLAETNGTPLRTRPSQALARAEAHPAPVAETEQGDSGEESYGEENVIYVEGDDSFAAPAASPRAVAMRSDHDASAERIRRLLEVYQSLGSRP